MIAGAVYREGVARTTDGAVYVYGLTVSESVPATAQAKGAWVPGGTKVTVDGELLVRYV